MVIDPHAHVLPEAFIRAVRAGEFGPDLFIEQSSKWELLMTRNQVLGRERVHRNPLPSRVYDIELRLKDMDDTGVDRQILSVVPPCMYYGLDAGLSREIAASFNDSLAGLARTYPQRFSCMATVALQDPQGAAMELDRAAGLGHFGVQIGSNVAGRNLDDPALDPFWEKVVSLDFPVLIHPIDVLGLDDRLKDYYLQNLIGNPLDTSIGVASLIFGGVLDRFPALTFLLSHTGGFTPWIRGRWQHGYHEREEPKSKGAQPPDTYLGRFYYDTIIHNPDCLEFAWKTLGADRLFFGTDYPFDMGYAGAAAEVPGLGRLPAADREKILEGNMRRLYRL
ncbi:MAG: amidohydrolase family protein [Thermodesulfobacteriota bacterium]